jgi:hypothetical protein
MNVFYTRYSCLQIFYAESQFFIFRAANEFQVQIRHFQYSSFHLQASKLSVYYKGSVSQHVTVIKFVQCHRIVNYFYTNKTDCHQIFVDKPDLKFKHFIATYDIPLSGVSKTRIPDLMGVSLP